MYTGIKKSRAWREFKLLQQMKNMDLNCPTPIAAMLKKTGLYYQADIILKKISSARDLHHILLANSLTADVWKKIGQTIAKFHHHQIYLHGDKSDDDEIWQWFDQFFSKHQRLSCLLVKYDVSP